jgi:hypothetical protein
MTPRLVSVHFGTAAGDQWPRLARVLAWSARRHCPGWEVDVRAFEPAPCRAPSASASCVANTQKLDEWARVVNAAADGDHLALLDADTMIVNPLEAVWDGAFDLAYTVRPPASPYPINAGVVFVRVGPGTRAFMTRWRDENRRMLRDRDHHAKWRKRYGGINQAALGCLLEQGGHDLALAPLPCQAWNCEDASWEAFDVATTRIVHIKSGFRRALFLRTHAPGCLGPLVKLWRGLEKAALEAEGYATEHVGHDQRQPLREPPSHLSGRSSSGATPAHGARARSAGPQARRAVRHGRPARGVSQI